MKRFFLALFLLSLAAGASAQGRKQLDSLKYVFPQFYQGTVIFSDKQVSRGLLNISPMDQMVYCISAQKDTLLVDGNSDIISVSAEGRYFVKWKESFVESIVTNGETGVGISRSTIKVNNVKTGAYGMASSTESIKSYSVNSSNHSFQDLIIDDPRNYVYTRRVVLFKGRTFLPVNKKSFEKLFPARKAWIESVWDERALDPADVDAVVAFYKELDE